MGRSPSEGFALVITLSLMVLLTLLAVGLLTLSSVVLRGASQGDAQARARANARLALMLAIGDLQRLTGPDQRVTGTAALLQGAGSTPPANAQWVGVWGTDRLKSETAPNPFIRANSNGSGYSDRRTSSALDPKVQALGWLVSGTDPSPLGELPAEQSVVAWSGTQPIRVPTVAIPGQGNRGALAYYVSDESTKARISLADPYAPAQPTAGGGALGFNRWVAPQSNDPTVWFPDATLTAAQASKILSNQQVELSTLAGGKQPAAIRKLVRDFGPEFTVYGRSVLADPVQGGLKRDLTSYLEDNKAPALGPFPAITDATVITAALTDRAKSGPKFGMLRNWNLLGREGVGVGDQRSLEVQTPNFTGSSVRIVDPGAAFVKPVIQPVLTEAVYYLRHVIDAKKVVELVYPRVVLWNPFAATLKTQGNIVLFDFCLNHVLRVTVTKVDGTTVVTTPNLNMNFNYSQNQRLGFYLPPTEFAPGEALAFFAPGKNAALNPDNLVSNQLSATASPSSLGFFRRDWPGGTLDPDATGNNTRISYDTSASIFWNTNLRTQTVTLHSVKGNSPTTASSLLNGGEPAIRQLSVDNYSRGNNGRWMPGYTPPRTYELAEVTNGNIPPDSLLAFGARFRFLYETYANRVQGAGGQEPWYFAPLIHHNIAAANFHRWPMDNIFGMEYTAVSGVAFGPHLYSYGPLAQARQWSEWLDPEVMPHRTAGGKNRTAVFTDASFATATSTYPVYDVPSKSIPLTSLGALQHVPLSPFAWHPSHVIGQSVPSPYVPLAAATTSRSTQAEADLWPSKLAYLTSGLNTDITGFDRVAGEVLLNDISYEVNQALWDRFFLSAIPRPDGSNAWDGDHWNLTRPLPNSRLTINPSLSNAGAKSELLDHYRTARALWLEGGFNIHSTRPKAWASLLRSFRDIEIPSAAESGVTAPAAFSGHLVAQGKGTAAALKASRDTYWNAYRKLSNDEIDALAEAIVLQVRKRAPFIGVADFVNRRLVSPSNSTRGESAFGGVLQVAIDQKTTINGTNPDWLLPTEGVAGSFKYGAPYWGGSIADPEPQEYKAFMTFNNGNPRQEGSDAASQLTQADILQQLGSVLVARGDTFVVRAYGDARDATGKVIATAWCEAVVQRTPEPVTPDPAVDGLNPKISASAIDWGRKYQLESFRWLSESDV